MKWEPAMEPLNNMHKTTWSMSPREKWMLIGCLAGALVGCIEAAFDVTVHGVDSKPGGVWAAVSILATIAAFAAVGAACATISWIALHLLRRRPLNGSCGSLPELDDSTRSGADRIAD